MTLVLSVHSRDTLWLVADRRLSYGRRRRPVDDAVKLMNLETADGVGLLGYAGLGATQRGTEPSDWMSAVLRGRHDLTFEQALGTLSAVADRELPRFLARTAAGAHFIIAPAFVDGVGPRLYGIDTIIDRDTGKRWYRFASHQRNAEPGAPSPRIAMAGTGGAYLARRAPTWRRALLGLVNAHDRRKISDHRVADALAKLNLETHRGLRDGSVGPRCIVAWRRRRGVPDASGGGSQAYTGVERDASSPVIPTVVDGHDLRAIGGVLMSDFAARIDTGGIGNVAQGFDQDAIEQLLAALPSEPDERLR